jgi:uncharacterized protein (TIGR02145 family)
MKTQIKTLIVLLFLFIAISGCKKTPEPEEPVLEKGTVTDIDGHVYKTVKIGDQWWMAEDLRVTKYRDSSFIQLVGSPPTDTMWKYKTKGAYCNNTDNGGNVIGIFYNYYAISDTLGIAPLGWHIPSDAEWQVLEKHLGMNSETANNTGWRGSHEGEKMKVPNGTILGWAEYGDIWPTNESGFSALAGGCRMFDGSWGDPGQYSTGFWWTKTETDDGKGVWYRHLDYKNANVFRYFGEKTYGFSVRCVKDN